MSKKVWVVVKDTVSGTSEVLGVFEGVTEAMYVSSEANRIRTEEVKEVYLQEHELQKESSANDLMNLKQFSEWIQKENAE